ncbi:MAG: PIN domain-containing protein [Balneolales bacterium]|nr:PIN domain-containing protein [Balneolales bacterium]
MGKKRVLLDVNVVLDVLLSRNPWCDDAAKILSMAENSRLEVFISAISVDTLANLLKRHRTPVQVNAIFQNLRQIVRIAAVDNQVIDTALALHWDDLEDAIQFTSAQLNGCQAIITRNARGYRVEDRKMEVLSPSDFVKAWW